MATRQEILTALRDIAKRNDGKAPGRRQFATETGLTESAWSGRYWARWSDALAEAGFSANKLTQPYEDEYLLRILAQLTSKLGHFPVVSEIKMERRSDDGVPDAKVFSRLGNKQARIKRLRRFCEESLEFGRLLALLPTLDKTEVNSPSLMVSRNLNSAEGFVYMMKLGKHFKIGKTFSVPRRHREVALELPTRPDVVHTIRTDDPAGIESYWHRRFEAKRTNGEWFSLDAVEVRAFKKRKFM